MFTTDHGIAFPQMKGTLYDAGTGVALMMRIPGKKAFVTDALVSHIDVFPTVCDVLGVPHPEWIQGSSLMPIIDGDVIEINSHIFTETTYHATYEPARAVRTKNMKYIRFFEDDRRIRLPNIDASACKDTFISTPFHKMQRPKEMLFDLAADPAERVNLIGVPEYAAEYERLSALLDEQMKATDDPLLAGKLELRDPWTMNKIDARDPDDDVYNCRGEIVKKAKIKK
jgi:arylsulfatase A-like enzyme